MRGQARTFGPKGVFFDLNKHLLPDLERSAGFAAAMTAATATVKLLDSFIRRLFFLDLAIQQAINKARLGVFFFLLANKSELLVSNDLDTLLPGFLVHKLKQVPIIFDSHEYFTQTPEVIHRPFVQKVWKRIEKSCVPRIRDLITVNESIADLFRNEYGVNFRVVRNIPMKKALTAVPSRAGAESRRAP